MLFLFHEEARDFSRVLYEIIAASRIMRDWCSCRWNLFIIRLIRSLFRRWREAVNEKLRHYSFLECNQRCICSRGSRENTWLSRRITSRWANTGNWPHGVIFRLVSLRKNVLEMIRWFNWECVEYEHAILTKDLATSYNKWMMTFVICMNSGAYLWIISRQEIFFLIIFTSSSLVPLRFS